MGTGRGDLLPEIQLNSPALLASRDLHSSSLLMSYSKWSLNWGNSFNKHLQYHPFIDCWTGRLKRTLDKNFSAVNLCNLFLADLDFLSPLLSVLFSKSLSWSCSLIALNVCSFQSPVLPCLIFFFCENSTKNNRKVQDFSLNFEQQQKHTVPFMGLDNECVATWEGE